MLKQKYAKSHCIQTTQPGRVFLNTDSPVKLVSHRYFELNDKFLYINLYAIGSPSPHHLNGVTFCLFSIKYLTFLCLLTLIGSSKWQAIQVLFGLLLYVNFWNKRCKFIENRKTTPRKNYKRGKVIQYCQFLIRNNSICNVQIGT